MFAVSPLREFIRSDNSRTLPGRSGYGIAISPLEVTATTGPGSGSATPAEAAAIAAAIQRFTVDTAVALAPVDEAPSPWLTAALVEGVGAKDSFGPGDPAGLA